MWGKYTKEKSLKVSANQEIYFLETNFKEQEKLMIVRNVASVFAVQEDLRFMWGNHIKGKSSRCLAKQEIYLCKAGYTKEKTLMNARNVASVFAM